MAFGDADASTPAFASVNTNWTTTGATSGSFTPPAGSLVVLFVYGDTSAAANPGNETVSDSGGGAAWTFKIRRAKPDAGSQAGTVAWWEKAFAAAPGSPITVTVVGNATGAASGGFKTHVVANCSGSEGHAEGSNTAAAVSLSITSTTDGARGVVAATDWNVQANMTAGAGQTALLASSVGSGPDTRVYLGIQNAVTSPAGSVTMSTTSPTSGNANNFIGGFFTPSAGGTQNASASLTGTATISPTAALDKPATSTLTGTATISPAAALDKSPSASLTGTATVTPTAALDKPITSTLTATATITATATVSTPGTQNASASLTGTATISPTASLTKAPSASLTTTATISPTASLTKAPSATLTGTATVTATTALTRPVGPAVDVAATITPAVAVTRPATADRWITATITATLDVVPTATGLTGNAHGPLPLAVGAITVHTGTIAGAVT